MPDRLHFTASDEANALIAADTASCSAGSSTPTTRGRRTTGPSRAKGNTNAEEAGIGGGIGTAPQGCDGHVTFYVEVPDVEAALA